MNVRHIPTMLSVGRVALSPLFLLLFVLDSPLNRALVLLIAGFFELSDILDGYFARRFKAVTDAGKLLDPWSDKIAHTAVFLAMLTEPFVASMRWILLLIFFIMLRDGIVDHMRMQFAAAGKVLAARVSGKVKTIVQGTGILIYLLVRTLANWSPHAKELQPLVLIVALGVMLTVSLLSLLDYLVAGLKSRS